MRQDPISEERIRTVTSFTVTESPGAGICVEESMTVRPMFPIPNCVHLEVGRLEMLLVMVVIETEEEFDEPAWLRIAIDAATVPMITTRTATEAVVLIFKNNYPLTVCFLGHF